MTPLILLIAVAGVGAWWAALWRGWRYASRGQTPAERRIVIAGIAGFMLLPLALAVAGASERTALIAIAVATAAVVPALIIVGARDHCRREERIRARRRGT